MRLITNQYGFAWVDDQNKGVLVERTCSNKKPKFFVLTVYDLQGTAIEILMRPRSTKIKKYKPPIPRGERE